MALRRVRVCVRSGAADITGAGYVAVTRVEHVEHLVFEGGLPSREALQEARPEPKFRERRRVALRLLVRFSRTLRKYRCCERDAWAEQDAAVAEALLEVLRARGARELGAARL